MAVTMQQIAEAVGVSRGTVDRALHKRGRIDPDVEKKVLETARQMGYRLNRAGQALIRSKKGFSLGVILQSAETPTIQDVVRGVNAAAAELKGRGVQLLVRQVQGLSVSRVLEEINSLMDAGILGLAIAPNNRPELVARIRELVDQGFPVVTLNSDAKDSGRLCFVGMDNYRAGKTAAALMCEMLPKGGKVFIVAGHLNNAAHDDRLNGFLDGLTEENRDDIHVLQFQPCFDRNDNRRRR